MKLFGALNCQSGELKCVVCSTVKDVAVRMGYFVLGFHLAQVRMIFRFTLMYLFFVVVAVEC